MSHPRKRRYGKGKFSMQQRSLSARHLRDYLRQTGAVSLGHLSAHFAVPIERVESVLVYWLARGRIVECQPVTIGGGIPGAAPAIQEGCSKGCAGCMSNCAPPAATQSFFIWKD
jgi:hypothetical protein